jgi:hypothetical protein
MTKTKTTRKTPAQVAAERFFVEHKGATVARRVGVTMADFRRHGSGWLIRFASPTKAGSKPIRDMFYASLQGDSVEDTRLFRAMEAAFRNKVRSISCHGGLGDSYVHLKVTFA